MNTLDIIRSSGWATIWLNQSDERNAMNDELMEAFAGLIPELLQSRGR